jgi:hypothetical protein
MRHFATIITASHTGYARVLLSSIREQTRDEVRLHVVVVDEGDPGGGRGDDPPGLVRHAMGELRDDEHFADITSRYAPSNPDALRWSLKPVFLRHLLERGTAGPVAYVDPDQYFVGDPTVLFDFAPGTRFRLSPHWRPIDPDSGHVFHEQFTDGIFNGGLFVAKRHATDILEWWASVCAYRCEQAQAEGLFDDQKYLDVVPVYFDGVDIIGHKGVNVARWNRRFLERRTDGDGRIFVEGDPLICVHFSPSTVRLIRRGEDPALEPVLRAYRRALRDEGVELHRGESEGDEARREAGSVVTRGLRKARDLFRVVRRAVRDGS